ncbi:PITH domain-containing protein [Mortierella sp. GBAus27b]|nr:Thioredoxin-like protein 1 [Mortierella sp. GBA43]KAI8358659.1 PITH domain-containing protein [Mortierella sp. GBAus27b]
MPVKAFTNLTEYRNVLASATPTKLIVVGFTDTNSPPSQLIKPFFRKLSDELPHVVFLEVDAGQSRDIAEHAEVTTTPTFAFYKANAKVASLEGANSKELSNLITQHQGPVEDVASASGSGSGSGSASASASASLVPGYSDITDQITLNQVDCLNQQSANHVRNALKADDTHLESDVDEQLIVSVPFNQAVKLHSIKIVPKNIANAPKTIKLYVNKLTLGFDETEDVEATQVITLTEEHYKGNGVINLRFVKFQSVTSVIMFIEDNLEDEETTQIQQIIFIGTSIDGTDMSALKKIEHDH